MALPVTYDHNLKYLTVSGYNAAAGTSTGSRYTVLSPVRGRIVEVGFSPNSLVASAMTMAVAIGNQSDSQNSNFAAAFVSSTTGTFASQVLFEGAPCSVVVPYGTNAFVQAGDAIQFTTSGGNAAGIGAYIYAIIKRGTGG